MYGIHVICPHVWYALPIIGQFPLSNQQTKFIERDPVEKKKLALGKSIQNQLSVVSNFRQRNIRKLILVFGKIVQKYCNKMLQR